MGNYLLSLRGEQAGRDANAHAELIHRSRAGTEQTIAQADGVAGQGVTGGFSGDMNLVMAAAAIPSVCGDKLVLKLSYVSGSSPYPSLYVGLTTP